MTDLTRRDVLGSVLVGAAAAGVPVARIAAAEADDSLTFDLYPGPIPNAIEAPDEEATRDSKEAWVYRQNVSRPTLSVHRPTHAGTRPAVIICPGGSYRGVSIDKEGHSVARAFNAFGVVAVVLKYRTPSARHMKETRWGPLQDVQQAFHVVRTRAAEWRIDPKRVGVVGFSAGGHLAASASTLFTRPQQPHHREVELRPDFSVLIYPVVSMADEITHRVSREQLLGPSPSSEALETHSAERAVSDTTPPAFLLHAADDASVLVANTLRYFEALNSRKIATQLVVYPHGGHGFGLNNPTTQDAWIDRVRLWMASEGWNPAGEA
jgi:acetyl esterase/lipase